MVLSLDPRTSITFHLEGEIVPKARPRVTSRGTFMPANYRQWKDDAIACLRSQASHQGIATPIDRAAVTIALNGKHPRRGDCDNISGAILDALVQAAILRGDNLNCVPALAIALEWSKEPAHVIVTLTT